MSRFVYIVFFVCSVKTRTMRQNKHANGRRVHSLTECLNINKLKRMKRKRVERRKKNGRNDAANMCDTNHHYPLTWRVWYRHQMHKCYVCDKQHIRVPMATICVAPLNACASHSSSPLSSHSKSNCCFFSFASRCEFACCVCFNGNRIRSIGIASAARYRRTVRVCIICSWLPIIHTVHSRMHRRCSRTRSRSRPCKAYTQSIYLYRMLYHIYTQHTDMHTTYNSRHL